MPDPRGLQRRLDIAEQALQRRQPATTRVELWDQAEDGTATLRETWNPDGDAVIEVVYVPMTQR